MRPATKAEKSHLRIATILNADDIEVCNPLGTARGEHKECGVQVATLNLPMSVRFTEDNILLTALAKAKVYKEHGMARVLAGIDMHGVEHDEPSYAKDMRELDTGRDIEIPDDETGGTMTVRLFVWLLIFSGDYLGAQSLLPFVESPAAHVFCRGCDVNSLSPHAQRPFSFLRGYHSPHFAERDWPELREKLFELRGNTGQVPPARSKKMFHDLGLNKLYFALDPEYIPHIDPTKIAPQDLLHLFPDGLLRSELAWMIFVFCKLGLDLDELNARLRAYSPYLPKDVRIPLFPTKLRKGAAGGLASSSQTARMTGSQCMHFAIHSFAILDPILEDCMRDDPAWASWLKLVELFNVTILHELHTDDVARIDDLQLEHQRLFDLVPEYAGLKRPKHHFCVHLGLDLWRYGPGRGYWCFGFEAFNRVIKGGAQLSNWKNTTVSIMRYWSARSARALNRIVFD